MSGPPPLPPPYAFMRDDECVVCLTSKRCSAFAPCGDVREVLTPTLVPREDTSLLLIDLGRGQDRLGGSVLAQVWNALGSVSPDVAPEDGFSAGQTLPCETTDQLRARAANLAAAQSEHTVCLKLELEEIRREHEKLNDTTVADEAEQDLVQIA